MTSNSTEPPANLIMAEQATRDCSGLALASLILGATSLIACVTPIITVVRNEIMDRPIACSGSIIWVIPAGGVILAILGITFGGSSLNSRLATIALVGILLSILAVTGSIPTAFVLYFLADLPRC